MKKKICSIINFIRLEDHRMPEIDHLEPVMEQMKLIGKYRFPATWLMQTDAMLKGPYPELFQRELPEGNELGIWLEITRLHCEAAGVEFRGRDGVNWDHHSQASLTIGYRRSERIALVEASMKIFHEKFGYYPRSVAAWYLDAFTLGYLEEKYHITATANCRDQWGTDGYSIWGGFWAGAYYPSRGNANLPGEDESGQIRVPLFRMLGSCPVNQYDSSLGENGQGVCTLEPTACKDPRWMKILFRNMFGNLATDYSYVQLGQENSFGWSRMKDGYVMQMEELAKACAAGEAEVMTMGDSGEWFLSNYRVTPPLATVALEDPEPAGRQAFWYNSRYYRASLTRRGKHLALRDLHCFDNRYRETYLESRCHTHAMIADALPVVEGFLWQKNGVPAEMKIEIQDSGSWKEPEFDTLSVDTATDNRLEIMASGKNGTVFWCFTESSVMIRLDAGAPWRILLPVNPEVFRRAEPEKLVFEHNGCVYETGLSGISGTDETETAVLLEAASGKAVHFYP